ncbi:hypothetical protein BZG36_01079 [Bifiguratus adelaidae]|uniref:Prenylcysteine lyase domain-containing protein n=1 Tax=Bifiguratus adelaidae TaxID=1938954 RepID=A0A261Y5Y9_9FUNG|nr:hypothetical protein BZG36_01079 [Bifiguratus adelaidae]
MKLSILFLLLTLSQGHSVEQWVFSAANDKRVAVIGAGAGGSSAAFWLSRAFADTHNLDISVFERNDYVGGRSTVVRYRKDIVELGASIFVPVNYNLMNATENFGLNLTDMVDLPWKHRFNALLKEMLGGFVSLYESISFQHVRDIVSHLGIQALVNQSAESYFIDQKGLKRSYMDEIVQSATRVNYGQDLDELHAFGAMISMAAAGAKSVAGGNYQIFEHFLSKSGASLHLNTSVLSINHGPNSSGYRLELSNGRSEDFDSVIIATPLHLSDISINVPLSASAQRLLNKPVEYKAVHVTLVVGKVRTGFFGRADLTTLPSLVITSPDASFVGGKAPFTCFAIHRAYEDDTVLVKFFSKTRLSEEVLDEIFETRSWTVQKFWDAYPALEPFTDASANVDRLTFILDDQAEGEGNHIYYVNALEPLVSTMETETLSAKNVVRLLHEAWCRDCKDFGDGWT